MKQHATPIAGLRLFELETFRDQRGTFRETYREERYAEAGLSARFVQDNLCRSDAGVLRGLHYQLEQPQAKLVHVVCGAVYDVAVDIRVGSPTFGRWFGVELSDENGLQLFVPEGFAHGYCALRETTLYAYKVSANYAPDDEHAIAWCDPDLAITWPIDEPLLSPRDACAPRLRDAVALPRWAGR
jgi:dTDP-4-dehydrorhamnose 3,5-epimerase